MQLRTVFWALLLVAVLITLLASPASAQISGWSFGGAFTVGGAHFRIGLAEAGPYGPSYYFEVAQPIVYPGYGCSDRCYRRGRHHYHHPTCGVVNHHFRRYGYAPWHVIDYYGPPIRPHVRPPIYGYQPQPRRYYSQQPYCCEKHYRKGHRHHIPPGQYKKHHGHRRDHH